MPEMPPRLTIEGTDTSMAYSEAAQQALVRYADDLANQASRMHPEIVELLKAEGVDGPSGLFGKGSSAEATANAYVKLAKRAADQAVSVAKMQRAMHLLWLKQVKEPVDAARAARERRRGGSSLKV